MTAIVPFKSNIPSLHMDEAELISVLSGSIYPGAKPESIKLVIGYCRAANLDPLQKPVHIVPMDVKSGKKDAEGKDVYEKRDVILPGVGLYRVQAARSNGYAGMGEPEFGPLKKLVFKEEIWEDGENGRRSKRKVDSDIEYPEWCKVTVYRIVNGEKVAFTAIEYWLENYATAGNWTIAPNKMWKKRQRGQLAKCAEAQALRKGFPEVGAAPTADEMEGKTIDAEIVRDLPQIEGPKARSEARSPADTGERSGPGPTLDTCRALIAKGDLDAARDLRPHLSAEDQAELDRLLVIPAGDGKLLQDGQKRVLRATLKRSGLTEIDLEAQFGKKLDELPMTDFNRISEWAQSKQAA